ncbi:MAG TPA: hypothetical protein VJS18_17640 [Paraburkholderia sp.]|nr:hypothetical protein [Paraburkholderia sp.]
MNPFMSGANAAATGIAPNPSGEVATKLRDRFSQQKSRALR